MSGPPNNTKQEEPMQPRIEQLNETMLVGMYETMSLVNNKTHLLFSRFMPRRREINHSNIETTFDLKIYSEDYFANFNPSKQFAKWALVEVTKYVDIPSNMHTYTLKGGDYAVFVHKGLSSDPSIFKYIFTTWLPNSQYCLDNRPHFDKLGKKTKRNDPNSEQEIWIPIRPK